MKIDFKDALLSAFTVAFLIVLSTSLLIVSNSPSLLAEPPSNGAEYLIITRPIFVGALQPLVDLKSQRMSVEVITVDNIENVYPGRDIPEQVRNCIRDYYENHGTQWVLLAGDVDPDDYDGEYVLDKNWEVPIRYLLEKGVISMPTDYYYAGLDGTWDTDNDNRFGEEGEVDWEANVYVGRIPARGNQTMQDVVDKTVAYENDPPRKLKDIDVGLFAAAGLKHLKCDIREDYIPTEVSTHELYEQEGNLNFNSFISAVNNHDPVLINVAGHGTIDRVVLSDGYHSFVSTDTPPHLTNRGFLMYAVSCWTNAFDSGGTCLGEAMLQQRSGGAVGYVGGMRSLSEPGCQNQDREFFKEIFLGEEYHQGAILYKSKYNYIQPYVPDDEDRYNLFITMLLGDPELKIVAPVRVFISPSLGNGLPGETINYTVTVKNMGNWEETYVLTVTDDAGWNLTVEPSTLTVPADENRTATLTVTVPSDVAPGIEDNITVSVISSGDPEANDNASCVALAGMRIVIYPSADIFGDSSRLEYDMILRTQLKFDVPRGMNIASAKLWLYWCRGGPDWDGRVTVNRVNDQTWDESINKDQFNDQALTHQQDHEGKWMSNGWDYVSVLSQLEADYGAGNENTSFRLRWTGEDGTQPVPILSSEGDLYIGCTYYSKRCYISLYSSEHDGYDPYLEIIFVPPPYTVSISPSYLSGLPGATLDYTIVVKNEDDVADNCFLRVRDNAGWPLALSENLLENLQPGENRTVTLSVTIPENLVDYAEDEINVTVTSTDSIPWASDTCIAAHKQWADFKLENLYKVSLDVRLYLREGSKLIVEFYTYEENYQAESVVWIGTTPDNVIFSENVPHPQGKPVEVTRLVLADENDNAISIIGGFVVRRVHLEERYMDIPGEWAAASEEERIALEAEMSDIEEQWPRAPSEKVEVSISPSSQGNPPGATLSYSVKVWNTGDFTDTYDLTISDTLGWGPTISPTMLTLPVGVSGTATLGLTIPENAAPDAEDNISVTATSQIAGVSASATCVARVIIRNVDVSISPSYQEGLPGDVLTYTVTVVNEGNVEDNYSLSADDNAGWNLMLSPSTLTVLAGENETATLSVTVPENAVPHTEDNVIVTAISQTDNLVSDNDSCITHAKEVPLRVIVRGDGNSHNEDQEGDTPWEWYGSGDYPPLMAAKRVGAGAVVASGTASTCRNNRWNMGAATAKFDVLLDEAFQWMVSGATQVLWYEGYGVYNNTAQCSNLVAALESKGYTITGNSSQPINADLLAPYDILVIPGLELGDKFVGGDPSLLPNADVEAIKSFVEGGNGLLIMEGSDFAGYNFYRVQNKILDALNFGLSFQHDEVEDPDFSEPYWFDAEVADVGFGVDYQTATGLTMVRVYGVCSLAEPL